MAILHEHEIHVGMRSMWLHNCETTYSCTYNYVCVVAIVLGSTGMKTKHHSLLLETMPILSNCEATWRSLVVLFTGQRPHNGTIALHLLVHCKTWEYNYIYRCRRTLQRSMGYTLIMIESQRRDTSESTLLIVNVRDVEVSAKCVSKNNVVFPMHACSRYTHKCITRLEQWEWLL